MSFVVGCFLFRKARVCSFQALRVVSFGRMRASCMTSCSDFRKHACVVIFGSMCVCVCSAACVIACVCSDFRKHACVCSGVIAF